MRNPISGLAEDSKRRTKQAKAGQKQDMVDTGKVKKNGRKKQTWQADSEATVCAKALETVIRLIVEKHLELSRRKKLVNKRQLNASRQKPKRRGVAIGQKSMAAGSLYQPMTSVGKTSSSKISGLAEQVEKNFGKGWLGSAQ